MKFALGLIFLSAFAGCSDDVSNKGLLGTYEVMIAQGGLSDPDFLSVTPAVGGGIVLAFTVGITTDAGAINASGLRASVGEGNVFTIARQPAHIDHSTGQLDGVISGNGKVTGAGMIMMTLHYLPMHFTVTTDGGAPHDMGAGGPTLDYVVSGMRQQ
jgi:hypothetical protein